MKKILILGLFVLISIQSYSQKKVDYYKDLECTKPINELKAKYKLTVNEVNDSIISKELYSLKNNRIVWTKMYKNDIPDGDWLFYKNNGEIDYVIPYGAIIPEGYLLMNINFRMDNEGNSSYEYPTVNKGEDYRRFVAMNVRYPDEAKEKGIQGSVYMQITISKDGEANNRRIVIGVDEIVDKEAIKLLNDMTIWNPAKLNGEPIDAYLLIPIHYKIN